MTLQNPYILPRILRILTFAKIVNFRIHEKKTEKMKNRVSEYPEYPDPYPQGEGTNKTRHTPLWGVSDTRRILTRRTVSPCKGV